MSLSFLAAHKSGNHISGGLTLNAQWEMLMALLKNDVKTLNEIVDKAHAIANKRLRKGIDG